MSLFHNLKRFYEAIIATGNCFQSILLLIMRLFWGYHFFITGMGKLTHIADTAGYFESLHIPFPEYQAYLVGGTECSCGLLLLLGLASRLASIPLIIVMIVAYLTAHLDAVEGIFDNPGYFMKQDPFMYLLTALIIFSFGPGKISLDYLIGRLTGWCRR